MSSDEGATRKKRARTESISTPVWPRSRSRTRDTICRILFWCRPVSDADHVTEPELVAIRKRLDVRRRNLPVGHAQDRPVERADARRTEPHAVNGPERISKLQEVTDAHGFVEDEREAADDVLQRLLCGQCDRDAADAESRQRRGGVDAKIRESRDAARADDQHVSDAPRESHQRDAFAQVRHVNPSPQVSLAEVVEQQEQPDRGRRSETRPG